MDTVLSQSSQDPTLGTRVTRIDIVKSHGAVGCLDLSETSTEPRFCQLETVIRPRRNIRELMVESLFKI
jgi:hypothetical protein